VVTYALAEQRPAVVRQPAGWAPLTRREREIAGYVAQGLTNQEIATRLVISKRTADSHVHHMLTKLGFTNRAQIAAWVAERRE
jgi:DNA-binding CsgD family transcriptional regulator